MVSATINVCSNHIIRAPKRLLTSSRAWHSQVVRYSALVGGIAYGIFHRRTLQAQKNKQGEHRAHHHRQQLIADAKKAWQQQQQSKKGGGMCIYSYGSLVCLTSFYSFYLLVITNPDDPAFDLEKFLTSLEMST